MTAAIAGIGTLGMDLKLESSLWADAWLATQHTDAGPLPPPLSTMFLDMALPALAAAWPRDLQLRLVVDGLGGGALFGGVANAVSIGAHLRSLSLWTLEPVSRESQQVCRPDAFPIQLSNAS